MIYINKKFHIGYTTGVFDMFHIGHLNIIKKAKEQCDYLIVGVTTDELCYKRKKKYPIIPESERVAIIEELKSVDRVILQDSMDKIQIVSKYGINAVFVGTDWQGSEAWRQYEAEFAQYGCEVVYLEYTDGISSSILRDRLNGGEHAL